MHTTVVFPRMLFHAGLSRCFVFFAASYIFSAKTTLLLLVVLFRLPMQEAGSPEPPHGRAG